MLKHSITIFLRSIKRDRSTFFINIIGLSTGLACVILIAIWVRDELAVDKFHANDKELYQVWNRFEENGNVKLVDWTPDMLAETMADKLPEVKYASPFIPSGWLGSVPLSISEETFKAKGVFAGKDYFRMFSYDFLIGNAENALSDIGSMVISESLAKRIFGEPQQAIGKALQWNTLNTTETNTIAGVYKDLPSNSTQQFDFVLPFKRFVQLSPNIGRESSWTQNAPITYILLKSGTDVAAFSKKVEGFSKAQNPDVQADLYLKQYSTNYLYGNFENGKVVGGRIDYIYLFSAIALFTLIIACINFMNLSTANATRRLKEIGVKKALGSKRKTLVGQYFGEALFTAFIALLIALVLIQLVLPQFNLITGKELTIPFNLNTIITVLGVTLLAGLLAGSYPALYLARFNPIAILRGKLKKSLNEVRVRKSLVVFQFSLSIILIVAVLVVYQQVNYIQSRNLGMDKDNVVYFQKEGRLQQNSEAFLTEVRAIPGLRNATTAVQSFIGNQLNNTMGVRWPGFQEGNEVDFTDMGTTMGLIETLNLEMKAGRSFSKTYASDSTQAIIFNETAVEAMGLEDPVGKTVQLWGQDRKVIGVVKDFHFQSFKEPIKPSFLRLVPDHRTFLFIASIDSGSEKQVLAQLENTYAKFNPGFTFDYRFLDQDYQALYESEQRVSVLSGYFAGLAILISCLGLFGLAMFTAERKRKEISIRKVLGQSAAQVAVMLSAEFGKLVLLAVVIGLPLAYLLTDDWLKDYAYGISLKWSYFLGAGLLALLIALLTVGSQALKAAAANPVNALKEE